MTAPDKPLQEQCAEHTSAAYHGLWVVKARRLLRESAAELSRIDAALARRPAIADIPSRAAKIERLCSQNNRLDGQQAELSRMRTALEEIRATATQHGDGMLVMLDKCAAIAERALTAGSGNE